MIDLDIVIVLVLVYCAWIDCQPGFGPSHRSPCDGCRGSAAWISRRGHRSQRSGCSCQACVERCRYDTETWCTGFLMERAHLWFQKRTWWKEGKSSYFRHEDIKKCWLKGFGRQGKQKTRQTDPATQSPSMFHGSVRSVLMSSLLLLYYSKGRKGTNFPRILILGSQQSFRRTRTAPCTWGWLIYALSGFLKCATSLQLWRKLFFFFCTKKSSFRFV